MTKNVCRGEQGYMEWHGKVANALDDLDSLGGVLVTVAAGNDGREKPPGRTDDYMPNILSARHGSPLIITGAVNNKGQLAKLSSPGTGKVPITCFAVYVYLLRVQSSTRTALERPGLDSWEDSFLERRHIRSTLTLVLGKEANT